ncbi:MAG TPA: hypothetical protein VMJ31_11555 [Methylocystis sp.]|nr:hypothetical protein [Methylocystis sp.]
MEGDGGLLADLSEQEKLVFIEGAPGGFVDELDDAQNFVAFAQGRSHPGLNFEIAGRLCAAFGEVRVGRRLVDHLRSSLLSDRREQPLGGGNARASRGGRILAGAFRQMQLARGGVHQPDVASASPQERADFAGDDGEKLPELECGSEGAADIIEGGQAIERGQMRVAFPFDGFEIRERLTGQAAGLFDKELVICGEFAAALAQDFEDALRLLVAGGQSRIDG